MNNCSVNIKILKRKEENPFFRGNKMKINYKILKRDEFNACRFIKIIKMITHHNKPFR